MCTIDSLFSQKVNVFNSWHQSTWCSSSSCTPCPSSGQPWPPHPPSPRSPSPGSWTGCPVWGIRFIWDPWKSNYAWLVLVNHLEPNGLFLTATFGHKLPQPADNTALHWGANIPIRLLKDISFLQKKNQNRTNYLPLSLFPPLSIPKSKESLNFWTMFQLTYF